MRCAISGNVMQTVAIDLARGETVYSRTNALAWVIYGVGRSQGGL